MCRSAESSNMLKVVIYLAPTHVFLGQNDTFIPRMKADPLSHCFRSFFFSFPGFVAAAFEEKSVIKARGNEELMTLVVVLRFVSSAATKSERLCVEFCYK